jgi:hypothetical protein
MGKYLGIFTLILLLTSCEKEELLPIQPEQSINIVSNTPVQKNIEYELQLDARLPIDKNGYYHLKLNPTSNQTIHRITGRVIGNTQPLKIEWSSNLYWWLLQGQTVANITKTYFNPFTGVLQYVNLPPLINWRDALVPTINSASYSGKAGEINTVIAPIYRMKNDTLIVKMKVSERDIRQSIKIVLE